MATIRYVSHRGFDTEGTGENQGDGSMAHPYRLISYACTPGGKGALTGGDEVRVEATDGAGQYPHEDLSGTFTFNNNNANVTTNQNQAAALAQGDFIAGYSGATNVTEWYEVVTVTNATTVALKRAFIDPTLAGGNYSGVSAKKIKGFNYNPATHANDYVCDSVPVHGTSPASLLTITGGYNFTTNTRDGFTWYRVRDPGDLTYADTIGLQIDNRHIKVSYMGYLRSFIGIEIRYGAYVTIDNCYFGDCRLRVKQARGKVTISNCKFVGGWDGYWDQLLEVIQSYNTFFNNCKMLCTGTNGVTLQSSYCTNLTFTDCYWHGVANTGWEDLYFRNCKFYQESFDLGDKTAYSDDKVYIYRYNQDVAQHKTLCRFGTIEAADGLTYGRAAGLCWKLTPSSEATSESPLEMEFARFAVNASKAVTAKIYMQKTVSSTFTLRCIAKKGQLAGMVNDSKVDAANNTSPYAQYILEDSLGSGISFTPTEKGVVRFCIQAYGTVTGIGWIDDFSIEQAA